jgi:hypothetical protein
VSATIWICGLGVQPPLETTMETLMAFSRCKTVFTDVKDKKLRTWLGRYCRQLKTPKSAADIIAAAKKGDTALAVWGHPQWSSTLARQLEAKAVQAKIPFEVLGAISPVGSAFARSISFLGGDYGYQGIQSYDLATLLASPEVLDARLPLVTYAEDASKAKWQSLIKQLVAHYPKVHEARLYPVGSEQETVSDLAKVAPVGGAVLLVPPDPRLTRKDRR